VLRSLVVNKSAGRLPAACTFERTGPNIASTGRITKIR
jgi:hypothetical protein